MRKSNRLMVNMPCSSWKGFTMSRTMTIFLKESSNASNEAFYSIEPSRLWSNSEKKLSLDRFFSLCLTGMAVFSLRVQKKGLWHDDGYFMP